MNSLGPLLAALEATELPTHLQHLRVRLSRMFAELITSPSPGTQHEQHIRLRSRLDEIEDELREAAQVQQEKGDESKLTEHAARARSYLALAEQAKATREQLEQLGRQVEPRLTPGRSAPPSRDVSSSPEPRVRKPRPSAAIPAAAAANLETFLRHSYPALTSATLFANQAKALSDAFTLHLLATSPSSVLPPGTSLASVFRSKLTQDPSTSSTSTSPSKPNAAPPSLEERVGSSMRAAYFAQAVEDISSGAFDSSAAARTWRKLRRDLWDAAGPLVPARLGAGSVKKELDAALTREESAFDLVSATELIKKLVELLAKLCAPARDAQVQSIAASLDPSAATIQSLVDGVKRTVELAEGMQEDLQGFRKNLAAATMEDGELEGLATKLAMERERKVVEETVGEGQTVASLTQRWQKEQLGQQAIEWATSAPLHRGRALSQALWTSLFQDQPVAIPSLPPPDAPASTMTTPNALPPVLFVPAPRLFALQNTLQAIVILACLQHLAPPSPSSASAPASSLNSRVWTLLTSTSAASAQPENWTHLAHLSDEIFAAWERYRSNPPTGAPPPPAIASAEVEATRIRSAIDRILRYEDPVYKLMKVRLKAQMMGTMMQEALPKVLPSEMRSGRRSSGSGSRQKEREWQVAVGAHAPSIYDRPDLKEKVEEAATEAWAVLKWAKEVWGEAVGFAFAVAPLNAVR